MNRLLSMLVLTATVLTGCGTSFHPFTRDVRAARTLDETLFHVSADIEFRSLRMLDTPDTVGFFKKNDGHRYVLLTREVPGKAVAHGENWVTVDFGRNIILTFQQSGQEALYVMPGWGTITIGGERYDIQVGVLSGSAIQLFWEPAKSPPPSQ